MKRESPRESDSPLAVSTSSEIRRAMYSRNAGHRPRNSDVLVVRDVAAPAKDSLSARGIKEA